jgi:hypothetical protein
MKKKLPMTPVRAIVRGTREVHAISIVAVPPGSIGCGSVTLITVRSSALPSSGAMNRCADVKFAG